MTKEIHNYASESEKINKNYYHYQENYDWVKATDQLVGLESFFHRKREKSFLKILNHYLKESKNERILDAGCGTGLFSRHLPASSVGIDINPRNIAKAKKHAPSINFMVGDLDKLPFANNYFSTIICTEVLEHFPNPIKPLVEMKRVLTGGGKLIGTVPNRSVIWYLRFLSSTRPHEPYHKYFRKSDLVDLFSSFKILMLQASNFKMNWVFVLEK